MLALITELPRARGERDLNAQGLAFGTCTLSADRRATLSPSLGSPRNSEFLPKTAS